MSKLQEILTNIDYKIHSAVQAQTIISLQDKLSLASTRIESLVIYAQSLEQEVEQLKNPVEE